MACCGSSRRGHAGGYAWARKTSPGTRWGSRAKDACSEEGDTEGMGSDWRRPAQQFGERWRTHSRKVEPSHFKEKIDEAREVLEGYHEEVDEKTVMERGQGPAMMEVGVNMMMEHLNRDRTFRRGTEVIFMSKDKVRVVESQEMRRGKESRE